MGIIRPHELYAYCQVYVCLLSGVRKTQMCVSGSLVSGAVCVTVEEESPLLVKAGVQEVQQEDSGEGCGSTSVSAVL